MKRLYIIRGLPGSGKECAKRNVHKVPLEVIQKMLDSWQDIQINHN
jgi:tRNA uridine 5-carbamoylmethylation protein Kti12